MFQDRPLTLRTLLRLFWFKITVTWALTLLETGLWVILPLLLGFTIDGLLIGDFGPFWQMIGVLVGLVLVAVVRQLIDTHIFGTMRVELSQVLAERNRGLSVSTLNVRVLMAREIVDYLEQEMPVLMAAVVQPLASVVILFTFHWALALSAVTAGTIMLCVYAKFHGRFFRLNRAINARAEKQVRILETRTGPAFGRHLRMLRHWEVRLSDTEALVYGLIYAVLMLLVVFNLGSTALIMAASAGAIFAIVTYSWEFMDAAFNLPEALQQWSRLSEIIERINKSSPAPQDRREEA
ncbi:MAG: ABC transporter six-transmembrane domain-containing protein [Pseudomonadota bacterium]